MDGYLDVDAFAVKRRIGLLLALAALLILLAYVDGGREDVRLIEQPVTLPPVTSWERVS